MQRVPLIVLFVALDSAVRAEIKASVDRPHLLLATIHATFKREICSAL